MHGPVGKRSRTCHVGLDGLEEQDGTNHRHLRWQLDRLSFTLLRTAEGPDAEATSKSLPLWSLCSLSSAGVPVTI